MTIHPLDTLPCDVCGSPRVVGSWRLWPCPKCAGRDTQAAPNSKTPEGEATRDISMTKDQAEARVTKALERLATVVRAIRAQASVALLSPGSKPSVHALDLDLAISDLEAAESALAALDKPRLMTPEEREREISIDPYFNPPNTFTRAVVRGIKRDRADILNQAEKLPRYAVVPPYLPSVWGDPPAILLSDLRNLLKGE